MRRGVHVGPPLLSRSLLCCRSETSERLISRFFLNLRSIHRYGESTAVTRTAVSVLSPIRPHSFWKRPRWSIAGFPLGPGARTSIYGDRTTRNGSNIPQAESFDMDVGMVLETRQDEENDEVKLDVGVITMDEIVPAQIPA
jgi:hypothetical protein